jgi:two-component system OmpR family response regulator
VRILIVEDDAPLRSLLQRGLTEDGHVVDVLADGAQCADFLASGGYDALILDLNLPHEDGLSILRRLRACEERTPVLILTARDGVDDVVAGLDAGADDYLRKPFAFTELEARLRSLARRPASWSGPVLRVADLEFDCETREARRGGRDLDLTAKESAFLEILMRNPGRTVTRRTLEDRLWDRETAHESNVLDVYARRLRVKLAAGDQTQLLHTVRGIGYKIEAGA